MPILLAVTAAHPIPNINICILYTFLLTFPEDNKETFKIRGFLNWLSFLLFSWPFLTIWFKGTEKERRNYTNVEVIHW